MLVADRYEILTEIGSGAMGVVYKGQDRVTGQDIAIKQLRSDVDDEMIARFIREGEVLRRLDHPNIVKMLDAVSNQNKHHLIMDYVQGGSLRERMDQDNILSIGDVLEIALELADALSRAHHLKIIHRDLKPSNVLLADDGTPRLSDFGVASDYSQATIASGDVIVGTLAYISPEAMIGERPDTRSDIWSFGMMLYELLGGYPYEYDNIAIIISAIQSEPIPELSQRRNDVPVALEDLIYRMLSKNPAERISSARLVGAELEQILGDYRDGISDSQVHILPAVSGRFAPATTSVRRVVPNNIIDATTPFVGRTDELAELTSILQDRTTRLVTLLGSGGMGKTRLAMESARQMLNQMTLSDKIRDGVYLIELAPLNSAANVPTTLAEAIKFPLQTDGRSATEQVIDYLQDRHMLLIFDNFEHVMDAVDFVDHLLTEAPSISVMVTSRERLNLRQEVLFRLGAMQLPDWNDMESARESGVVKLFTQGARRLQPNFTVAEHNFDAVAEICKIVHGMPLAIVLASSWLEILSEEEIVEEIQSSLDFLETEMRNIPDRHRSIRAVWEASWHQLSESEQEVFARLSIFRGGFSRRAVQTVAQASLRALTSLTNKSLLIRDADAARYDIQEILRQFAAEKLAEMGEDAAAADAHAQYYLDSMEKALPNLKGKKQLATLDDVEQDIDNIRSAWLWAVEHNHNNLLSQAMEPLRLFSYMRSRQQDIMPLFVTALESLSDEDAALYNQLLARVTGLADLQAATETYEACITAAAARNDDFETAFCLLSLAYVEFLKGNAARTTELYERSTTIMRSLGESLYVVENLVNVAFNYDQLGDPQKGSDALYTGLSLSREIGHRVGEAYCLGWLGTHTHFYIGDYEATEDYYQQALNLLETLGQRAGVARAQAAVGQAAFYRGAIERARSLSRVGLKSAVELRIGYEQGFALNTLGLLACFDAQYEEAIDIFEQSRAASSHPFLTVFRDWGHAVAAFHLNDLDTARDYLTKAGAFAHFGHMEAVMTWLLPLMAQFAVADDDLERATELLALAYTHERSPINLFQSWDSYLTLRTSMAKHLGDDFDDIWQRGTQQSLTEVIAQHFGNE